MTKIEITLPDTLASEAAAAGLLEPNAIASILRRHLRAAIVARLQAVRAKLDANAIPPMSPEEINAEIDAVRAGRRHAYRS